MRPDAWPALDVPRLLGRQRLLERDLLAVLPARLSRAPLASLPRDTPTVDPDGLPRLRRVFRTVIDLAVPVLPPARRDLHLRALEDAVQPDGYVHVVGGVDPQEQLGPTGLVRTLRCGWTLLTLQDTQGGPDAGPGMTTSGAWVASFLRVPPRRRPARPAVKHFSDLGAFSSLDLGRPTDQPPWGT